MDPANNKISKGVYLLPNALTTGAMFAGFFSIISGINGHYVAGAVAVVVAGVLDGLDGRVARLTNTQSEFGVQYDSLSDLISFGLAPALLVFNWSLASLRDLGPTAGKLGWLAAFLFVACAALRLARFNTQVGVEDKSYFQGLASPAAAGLLVATVWFFADRGIAGESVRWLIWLETVGLGLLMFSRVRYFSGKGWPSGDRIPLYVLFLVVLVIVFLALDPPAVLLTIGLIYVGSGLVVTVLGRYQWRSRRLGRQARRKHDPDQDTPEESAPEDEQA
ncbi:CDP-diacylglycerol--serine O-phosphatidyltransferase [Elongatibacter sediminis]|uniref:CDP-diacylglycerol--serine O-phosphatidyltransferase n=1 Tax=Elongatibacter sediminis TaxID=3119006 RepID=A0AAW9R8E0_9GAMM